MGGQLQQQDAVFVLIEQETHGMDELALFQRGREYFMHRLLPAGGIAAYQGPRDSEAARLAHVVGSKIEGALEGAPGHVLAARLAEVAVRQPDRADDRYHEDANHRFGWECSNFGAEHGAGCADLQRETQG